MNNIFAVFLTLEGEKQLIDYYRQISKISIFLGTTHLVNWTEVIENKKNIDGSYNFTIDELISIFALNTGYFNNYTITNSKTKKYKKY